MERLLFSLPQKNTTFSLTMTCEVRVFFFFGGGGYFEKFDGQKKSATTCTKDIAVGLHGSSSPFTSPSPRPCWVTHLSHLPSSHFTRPGKSLYAITVVARFIIQEAASKMLSAAFSLSLMASFSIHSLKMITMLKKRHGSWRVNTFHPCFECCHSLFDIFMLKNNIIQANITTNRDKHIQRERERAVSYTHLTLPTRRTV